MSNWAANSDRCLGSSDAFLCCQYTTNNYMQFIKPVWTYGIQLWGSKNQHQSHSKVKSHYVRKEDIHRHLKVPMGRRVLQAKSRRTPQSGLITRQQQSCSATKMIKTVWTSVVLGKVSRDSKRMSITQQMWTVVCSVLLNIHLVSTEQLNLYKLNLVTIFKVHEARKTLTELGFILSFLYLPIIFPLCSSVSPSLPFLLLIDIFISQFFFVYQSLGMFYSIQFLFIISSRTCFSIFSMFFHFRKATCSSSIDISFSLFFLFEIISFSFYYHASKFFRFIPGRSTSSKFANWEQFISEILGHRLM